MRTKTLNRATWICKVVSENKGMINMESLMLNGTGEYMPHSYIEERGIRSFINADDMKESLNWDLNGDSSKFCFK